MTQLHRMTVPRETEVPRLIFAILSVFLLAACASLPRAPAAEIRTPVTILISIDAFRPDYLARGDTPVLDALEKDGLKATMRPSYPVLTFPNHMTLVSGLRPDRNGIVANIMFDPRRPGDRFYNKALESSDPFWWAEAEPIWITAEKAGIRTGTMFWPGEEAAHDGIRPSDWARFDPNFTSEQRFRTVVDWMRRPAAIRPRFVTVYLDDVDKAGHKHGPWGAPTIDAVRQVDALIGEFAAQLKALGQPVNFVIVSDHGMRAVQPERTVLIDRLLPKDSFTLISYGPFATIAPTPGQEEAVARILLAPHKNMTCWRKADVPTRFHYGANPRVAPFVCQSEAGAEIMTVLPTNKGDHGYNVDDPEMTALFLASGPAFDRTARVPAKFDNVDLYPLLARLIGVAPLPGDGDAAMLSGIISKP